MSAANVQPNQDWGRLADLSPADRQPRMVEKYRTMAGLPDSEGDSQMNAMVLAEYALTDDKLRDFTHSRLRAWLAIDEQAALRIAKSYDTVMLKMPGKDAMRRVSMVQTIAREMSIPDVQRLSQLVPAVLAGAAVGVAVSKATSAPAQAPTAPAKKGFGPFGKKG
ncbi:MAG: hypothetical protein FJ315_03740 [SAR202 cluster bacterium]|nr:hypothetical protein [SAR202 cluster bacterium]